MRNKLTMACAAIMGCLAAGQGVAAPATIGELDEILSQTIVMQARQRLQEARLSLGGRTAGADAGISSASIEAGSAVGLGRPGTAQPATTGLPGVVGIYGAGDTLSARLAYDANTMIEVHTGSALAGGERVVAIDHNTVTVRGHDGKRVPLGPYLGGAGGTGAPAQGVASAQR